MPTDDYTMEMLEEMLAHQMNAAYLREVIDHLPAHLRTPEGIALLTELAEDEDEAAAFYANPENAALIEEMEFRTGKIRKEKPRTKH